MGRHVIYFCAPVAFLLLTACGGTIVAPSAGGQTQALGAREKPDKNYSCLVKACIYIANAQAGPSGSGGINAYKLKANGNVTPVQPQLSGSYTQLYFPSDVAVDASHNVYVANGYASESESIIAIYAPPASGNVAPAHVISDYQYGSPPQWGLLGHPGGIALDSSGNIYASATSAILEYAAGSYGPATPTKILYGGSTDIATSSHIAVDKNGNIWCACGYGDPGFAVLEFSGSASGDAAPIREIEGPNTMLLGGDGGGGITLDRSGNIYVTVGQTGTSGPPGILVFRKNANGNVKPLRIIAGANTQLVYPLGLTLDSKGDIYVADDHAGPSGGGSVNVFAKNADGNVAPLRTITGSVTQMFTPEGIAVH